MTGNQEKLLGILGGVNKFIIPAYQRNYNWKKEQCQTLFNDLVNTIKSDYKTHFLGGIVTIYEPGLGIRFKIIDGQQRIVTVMLLLLALANLLKKGEIEEGKVTADEIIRAYLADAINPSESKLMLKTTEGDAEAFAQLWHRTSKNDYPESNITNNYKFLCAQILKSKLTATELLNAIDRLQVIGIKLEQPTDKPQLVFESLNSTGLAMNDGDKIRNYILMGLETAIQDKYYEDYWSHIEKMASHKKNRYDLSSFICDYLRIKRHNFRKKETVYNAFKRYAESEPVRKDGVESLLSDMLAYAIRYAGLLLGSSDFKTKLNFVIQRLNRLNIIVTRPFLMEVLRLCEDGKLEENDTIKVFQIVESFLFRRIICDLPSDATNRMFFTLARDIKRLDKTWDKFTEKLKYILLTKEGKACFPDDDEFVEGLRRKDIYNMLPHYKSYLFERLENMDSKNSPAPNDIYRLFDLPDDDDYKLTIEHIMPQKLTPKWRKALEPNCEKIHNNWLHKLANLTFTASNKELSTKVFEEKRKIYKNSGYKLNKYIAEFEQWGKAELKERENHVITQAPKLWPFAETKYIPPEIQPGEHEHDLSEVDFDYTKIPILKFSFNEHEQTVHKWVEMFETVLKILHEEDETIFYKLADADDSVDLANYFSRLENKFTAPLKIADNLFIYAGGATNHKLGLLRKFFELFEEAPENLVFRIKIGSADPEL